MGGCALWRSFGRPASLGGAESLETPQRWPWSSFANLPIGNGLESRNTFRMLQEWGGGQFFRSIHEAVGSTEKTLSRGFCPLPMGNGLGGQKLPAICGKERGGGRISATHLLGEARSAETQLVRPWEHSIENLPPAAVLPFDALFDQPTIPTLDALADEPSTAALDALAANPSPLLDAMAEQAAANERYLVLVI